MEQVKFNPVLHLFFKELLQWIEGGCRRHSVFSRSNAICCTLSLWCKRNLDDCDDANTIWRVNSTLDRLFQRDYGEVSYPFNDGGCEYLFEANNNSHWRNIHRCAFVYHYAKRSNW